MSDSEPKGCLAAILGLFGIKLGGPAPAEHLPFRLRDDFLSAAELSFYRVLAAALREQAVVTCKVNLADLFYVAKPNENRALKNKIDRKHVDFLVCDPTTMKPRCGIELDDSSHSRRDRQDRDEFVDAVFAAAGLPLLRVPAKASYNPAELTSLVSPLLSTPSRPLSRSEPPAGSPVCPKCQVPMVERVATKGQSAGRTFLGCPNYPRCREIQNA